jgi:hypothetical protein
MKLHVFHNGCEAIMNGVVRNNQFSTMGVNGKGRSLIDLKIGHK